MRFNLLKYSAHAVQFNKLQCGVQCNLLNYCVEHSVTDWKSVVNRLSRGQCSTFHTIGYSQSGQEEQTYQVISHYFSHNISHNISQNSKLSTRPGEESFCHLYLVWYQGKASDYSTNRSFLSALQGPLPGLIQRKWDKKDV